MQPDHISRDEMMNKAQYELVSSIPSAGVIELDIEKR
jgi:hypothetical protein